ncbi:hypothetical protein SDC9_102800 [bioreactor metagenome]|uniref:Uncharacterized protein n=1 Tax=bioreactor metagenome TaxID=1076179 RepID=A0A645ARU6_9ZZZZ
MELLVKLPHVHPVDENMIHLDVEGKQHLPVGLREFSPGNPRDAVILLQAHRMVDGSKGDPGKGRKEGEVRPALQQGQIEIGRAELYRGLCFCVENGDIVLELHGDHPEQLFVSPDAGKGRVDPVIQDHFSVHEAVPEVFHPVERLHGKEKQGIGERQAAGPGIFLQPGDVNVEVHIVEREIASQEKLKMLFPAPCFNVDFLHFPSARNGFDSAQAPVTFIRFPVRIPPASGSVQVPLLHQAAWQQEIPEFCHIRS